MIDEEVIKMAIDLLGNYRCSLIGTGFKDSASDTIDKIDTVRFLMNGYIKKKQEYEKGEHIQDIDH